MTEREGASPLSAEQKWDMSNEEWRDTEKKRLKEELKGANKSEADRKTGLVAIPIESKDKEYLETELGEDPQRHTERPMVLLDKDVAPRKRPARGQERRTEIEEGVNEIREEKQEGLPRRKRPYV